MTLILALTAIVFTYIPGIRAKDFEVRSQRNRPVEEMTDEVITTDDTKEKSWSISDIHEPIDLEDYSLLVPRNEYHYYEDSRKVIFYKDESRMEPLLECDIIGRLDSNGSDPKDKLVYSNDRYMAVFTLIEDWRGSNSMSFSTGTSMLFRKP